MSFSSKVKDELSRLKGHETHCLIAEMAAIITMCGRVEASRDGEWRIELHTENAAVARRFFTLIKAAFSLQPELRTTQHDYLKKNRFYVLSLENPADALRVLKTVGLINNLGQIDPENHLEDSPVLQRTCCKRAFLRGAFLAAGSVTTPEKNYHYELVCNLPAKAELLKDILEYFDIEARIIQRKKNYVVYLKDGSMISEVLNVMEAHISMMAFENTRIVKEVRNTVNRRVNCEAANINKTVNAALKQIEDIELISRTIGLSELPVNLREMAGVRMDNPDASLKELGEMLSPPVGKSGVNHRLRKISQIADDLRMHK